MRLTLRKNGYVPKPEEALTEDFRGIVRKGEHVLGRLELVCGGTFFERIDESLPEELFGPNGRVQGAAHKDTVVDALYDC